MSGGSYSYLYCKNAGQLFEDDGALNELDCMASRLIELGYKDVGKEMLRLYNTIQQAKTRVEVMLESLSGVMHAVEWYDSADYGIAEVKKEIEKYYGAYSGKPGRK